MNPLLRPIRASCVPLALYMALCYAADTPQGRWEGQVQIPGAPMTLIVDLAPDGPSSWTGSVIIPGMGVKGAPLGDIVVTDSAITFNLSALRGRGVTQPTRVNARLAEPGTMVGQFEQAGNTAAVALKRIGPAQVEPAPKSTAIATDLEGAWVGRYEMGGYARDVTLTLSNHPQAAATAELQIAGKRINKVPVDRVVQDAQFLRIEAPRDAVTFEGRWRAEAGEIQGSIQVGPFEVPLVLRHSSPTTGGKS